MTETEFEKKVVQALSTLPKRVQDELKNVAVTIESAPRPDQLQGKDGTHKDSLLLGLYEGIPEIEYGKGFGGNLPDKITIFKDAIEEIASSSAEIEQIVAETVWHEIAHHFGYTDEELQGMEQRKGFLL